MAEKKTEAHVPLAQPAHATSHAAPAPATTGFVRMYSEAEEQRQKELEANRQKRADLKSKTQKQGGFAFYQIKQPYYRQGQWFPTDSIVRIPEDEEPSITWLAVEKAGTAETPITTAGQMNEPVRKPTAPFTSEPYEKEESNVETNPPGKEKQDAHYAVKDATKDAGQPKRPSDKNL